MKQKKGIYYFSSYEKARQYALDDNWPIDRIRPYQLGWAIQLYISGPYVGTELINQRRTHNR